MIAFDRNFQPFIPSNTPLMMI